MRTIYLNGSYLPENEAKVSVFDRGFMFGDAVYEVTAVIGGRLIDFAAHMARLRRSLLELGMVASFDEAELAAIHARLVKLNAVTEGLVYVQVSRGMQDRNFAYPDESTPCTWVIYTQEKAILDSPIAKRGLSVISLPDLRWQRSDIKTTQLLYACMAKEAARQQGADDAWLVRDGLVTEGSSNNAFILTAPGSIVTRELSQALLPGITRSSMLTVIQECGYRIEERAFSLEEAKQAVEAFVTSSTTLVYPVISIDGHPIGSGKPGTFTRTLREAYIKRFVS
ncbi:D-amino-acid transaminase [Pseudomonas sp. BN417]|uniref:D-amino-acid transaminase n=1 Tax=Pseudomonas sp. BN417 TaxID=2567890 RepID=UPI002457AF90|nr:D-amino-acid transaminase [Pseudomonas sp. BN417]MDH4554124.1 D-amino-acid transaminase [Pseudomonas sp. BN417]